MEDINEAPICVFVCSITIVWLAASSLDRLWTSFSASVGTPCFAVVSHVDGCRMTDTAVHLGRFQVQSLKLISCLDLTDDPQRMRKVPTNDACSASADATVIRCPPAGE